MTLDFFDSREVAQVIQAVTVTAFRGDRAN